MTLQEQLENLINSYYEIFNPTFFNFEDWVLYCQCEGIHAQWKDDETVAFFNDTEYITVCFDDVMDFKIVSISKTRFYPLPFKKHKGLMIDLANALRQSKPLMLPTDLFNIIDDLDRMRKSCHIVLLKQGYGILHKDKNQYKCFMVVDYEGHLSSVWVDGF